MNISFQGALRRVGLQLLTAVIRMPVLASAEHRRTLLAGAEPIAKGLHTYQYGVALESNQSCAQQMAQRAALQAAATRRNRTAPPIDFGLCVI